MDENLKKIKKFFKYDLYIKESIYNLAPPNIAMGEEERLKYVDDLYKEIKIIKDMLLEAEEDFNISSKNDILKFFENIERKITNFNYKNGDVKKLYNDIIADISEPIIDEVNENCYGYGVTDRAKTIVSKCKTINELLHVYHSDICNNEEIIQSMPKLSEPKINKNGYPITLYGIENEFARKIFDSFPAEIDAGITDILSLDDRVLMMIRDRGHALSIEITRDEKNQVCIKYFIPKICNVEMVNKLRGVNLVKSRSGTTKGQFIVSREDSIEELFKFIEGVPTDLDMPEITHEDVEAAIIKPIMEEEEPQRKEGYGSAELTEFSAGRRKGKISEVFRHFMDHIKGRNERTEKTNEK